MVVMMMTATKATMTLMRSRRKRNGVTWDAYSIHFLESSHEGHLGCLGAVLCSCRAVLGTPWGPLGPSRGSLGPSSGLLGRLEGLFAEPPWDRIGPSRGSLRPSWILDPSRGLLGPAYGSLWAILG
eukprot:1240101-Pyramimonas_sp.AAC.1